MNRAMPSFSPRILIDGACACPLVDPYKWGGVKTYTWTYLSKKMEIALTNPPPHRLCVLLLHMSR